MTEEQFEQLVAEEFPNAIPENFRDKIRNVAFLIEQQPSQEVRKQEGLGPHETLLGLYHGLPNTVRGDIYGVGNTLPDTITLYMLPILQEATLFGGTEDAARKVIRDTIWHEVGHYFGMDEHTVRRRESERQNGIL